MNNETVKLIRHYLKMSQVEFCEHIGVTYSTVAGIETGHKRVTDNVIAKISHVFDVTDEDFLNFVRRSKELKQMIELKKQS